MQSRGHLYLQFRIGTDRYALDTALIVEVLARAPLKQLPGTPSWVAGLLDYRGRPVPVVDVSQAAGQRPAPALTSTRLVVSRYAPQNTETPHLLGLLLEGATDTVRLDAAAFKTGGLRQDGAPFLGPVTQDGQGFIQRADIELLLDDEARALLFPDEVRA